MTKKRTVLIICGIISICIVFLSISVGRFIYSTTPEFDNYCTAASNINANEFEIFGNSETMELLPYRFAVAKNGDSNKQELLIFREKPFGLIKSTGRYELVYQSQDTKECAVGSLMFKAENTDKNLRIFYSKNTSGINYAEINTLLNKNGKDIEKKIKYSTSFYAPFLFFSPELDENEQIREVVFKNESEIIFSY